MRSLLRGRNKLLNSSRADRHVVEVESKFCALINHQINKFVTCYLIDILRGVANRKAVNALILFEKLHCFNGSLVSSRATAEIV